MLRDFAKLLKTAVTIEKDTERLNKNIEGLVKKLEEEREKRVELEHRLTRLEAKEEAFNQAAALIGRAPQSDIRHNLPHHNGTSGSETRPKE